MNDEQPEGAEAPEAAAPEQADEATESAAQEHAAEATDAAAPEQAQPEAAQPAGEPSASEPGVEQPQAAAAGEPAAVEPPQAEAQQAGEPEAVEQEAADEDEDEEEPAPRVKPEVPGMHLEVDIVPEGADPLGREDIDPYATDPYAVEEEPEAEVVEEDRPATEPITSAAIDLAAGARYIATGKRKTAIARVILRPGTGAYLINGRSLEQHFPRSTLQRNIRQPLEAVGYQERMDVVARLHGGGISAQAGALRHGVSKALIDADPNLRGELKRRGFLTRDARVKERKKAGLKKARKRPQFSKR
jgi:small subunit ribosomal protein S9